MHIRWIAPVAVLFAFAPVAAAAQGTKASTGNAGSARASQVGVSLTPSPSVGAAPLKVQFKLTATASNVTSWTLTFGDGTSSSGKGKPPAFLSHTYKIAKTYKAIFAVNRGVYSVLSATAKLKVSNMTLKLGVSTKKGASPLTVKFSPTALGSGAWKIVFGDGSSTGGTGKVPDSISHTYTKHGTFTAVMTETVGGVKYSAPNEKITVS